MKFYAHLSKKDEEALIKFSILCFFIIVPITFVCFNSIDIFLAFFMAIFLFVAVLLPFWYLKKDYICIFDNHFMIHFASRKVINENYPYSMIRRLYVDDCPSDFCYPIFRMSYSRYIIATDIMGNYLFACIYSTRLWNILVQKSEIESSEMRILGSGNEKK